MSYVDALHNRDKDIIHVVERVNGERVYKDYPADYVFYYDDQKGKYRTMFDTPVSRFSSRSSKEYQKELNIHKSTGRRIWESDFKPVFRCLETNYLNQPSPKLHTAFLDIEVAFSAFAYDDDYKVKVRKSKQPNTEFTTNVRLLSQLSTTHLNHNAHEVYDEKKKEWVNPLSSCYLEAGKGYSKPEDPFNAITAISIYLDWLGKLITLVIPPYSLTWDEAEKITSSYENCFLFATEEEMLNTFYDVIGDADVLSGWNSEGFDIPYIVMRTARIMSKDDTRRLSLWDQMPKQREFERYGATQITFDIVGRVHLDYMQLYRKYTYEERHSYSLDAIGEYELDERKVAYEGTLDSLYNMDFYKFIDYNRQDTMLLAKLDKKLCFIDLANELAHENTVLLPTTMGAVAVTEQAIINEAHGRNMIVPNRKGHGEHEETQAAGAYVAYPRKGIHEYIGAIDINSLYPSTIRALNMGPETIVGQLRPVLTDAYLKTKMDAGETLTAAWEGLFGSLEYSAVMRKDPDVELIIDWETDGNSTTHSAAEVWEAIFNGNQQWTLSANGTIFKYDIKGVVPGLLERWYADRKVMQKKKKLFGELKAGIPFDAKLPPSNSISAIPPSGQITHINIEQLFELVQSGNEEGIVQFASANHLVIRDGKIFPMDLEDCEYAIKFWDKKQLVTKIKLNSLYGALLNQGCRFEDHRIGQSTTLTGRIIAQHMDAHVNQVITGEYDHVGKSVIYGDSVTGDTLIRTDSGQITIAELYNQCLQHEQNGDKEYGMQSFSKVIGFNSFEDSPVMANIAYVMRHKTKKKLYKITLENNKTVTVTEDHSVMVDRDGFLTEVRPAEIQADDLIICLPTADN